MMQRTLLSCAALALLRFAAPASAAPIVYNEAIDGDLPQGGAPLPTFTFDLGVNTVSGTTDNSTDFDAIAFTVPGGMEMSEGDLVLSDLTGDVTSVFWSLREGNITASGALVDGSVGATSPGVDSFGPLSDGTYYLSPISIATVAGGGFHSAAYTYSFTVTPIPEPGALAMLGVGSLALLSRRRRGVASLRPIQRAVQFWTGPALHHRRGGVPGLLHGPGFGSAGRLQ